jgi:hypothetical protein
LNLDAEVGSEVDPVEEFIQDRNKIFHYSS